MISVVIPVGPRPSHRRWLADALRSVAAQERPAGQVLIVDDMAGLNKAEWAALLPRGVGLHIWRAPWLQGVAHAFNAGVALAAYSHVVMLGSDDLLQPWALGDAWAEWERWRDPLGSYHFDVEYMDTGEQQNLACNAAMVTKALWQQTGGFPVESAIGAPDTMLISQMIGGKGEAGRLYRVDSPQGPPYLYRRHAETDTAARAPAFAGAIYAVRDTLTRQWAPPEWGRYTL
jgi:glycosyltransferase involved in cell wall biosynthesis